MEVGDLHIDSNILNIVQILIIGDLQLGAVICGNSPTLIQPVAAAVVAAAAAASRTATHIAIPNRVKHKNGNRGGDENSDCREEG